MRRVAAALFVVCTLWSFGASAHREARKDTIYRPGPPHPGTGWILQGNVSARIGLVFPVASKADYDPSAAVTIGYNIELDAWVLRAAAGGVIPLDDKALKGALLEVGALYYLFDNSVTPIAAFGVSPRLVGVDVLHLGFAPFGSLGVYYGNHDVAFTFEARATQNVAPIESRYPLELGGLASVNW